MAMEGTDHGDPKGDEGIDRERRGVTCIIIAAVSKLQSELLRHNVHGYMEESLQGSFFFFGCLWHRFFFS